MNQPQPQPITRPTLVRSPNERIRVFLSPSDPLLVGKYHAQAKHVHVVCDSRTGAFTVRLPDLRMCEVQEFVFYNAPSIGAGNVVTVTGERMEGNGTSHALNPGDTVTFVSDLKTRWLLSDVNSGPWEPAITAGTTGQYWCGDKTWQTLPSSGIGGSGTLNYIPKWSPDGTHLGDSLLSETATGINLTLAGTPRAANNLLTMLQTVDTGGVTGTELLISTKQRKSGVDCDVCSFGGIVDGTYSGSLAKIGGFAVYNEHNGALGLTMFVDKHGYIQQYYTGTTQHTADQITAFSLSACHDPASIMSQSNGRELDCYGNVRTTHVYLHNYQSAASPFIWDARIQDTVDPTTCVAIADAGVLAKWTNLAVDRLNLYGDGSLTLHYSGLAHGMTGLLPTDAWGLIGVTGGQSGTHDPTYGGLHIVGAAGGSGPGLLIHAIGASSCSIHSMLDFVVGNASGTGITDIGATTWAMRLVNNTTPLLGVYGDGSVRMPGALGVGTSTPTTSGRIQCSENLLVDGSFGVGTSAPGYKLHIQDTTRHTTLGAATSLMIGGGSGGSYVGDCLDISFKTWNDFTHRHASIGVVTISNAASEQADLYFATKAGTGSSEPIERMRITAGGTVNIASLAGSGTRAVVVDAAGNLSAP